MSRKLNSSSDPNQPMVYQIRIKGHLGSQWAEWFEGMNITEENGDTVLTGRVADQSALHGVLTKIRNLNLPIVSVNRVKPE